MYRGQDMATNNDGSDEINSGQEHHKKEEKVAFDYGQVEGKGAEASGLLSRNSQAHEAYPGKGETSQKKKDKEFRELVHRIEEAQKHLDDMKALIEQRLEEITIERDQIAGQINSSEEKIDAIALAHEKFKQTGEFELNEKGELADPVLEDIIRKWEKKNGKVVERDNFGLIEQIILAEQKTYKNEIDTLEARYKKLEEEEKQIKDLRTKLDKVDQRLNSDNPDEQQKGLDQMINLDKEIKEVLLADAPLYNNQGDKPKSPESFAAVSMDNKFSF